MNDHYAIKAMRRLVAAHQASEKEAPHGVRLAPITPEEADDLMSITNLLTCMMQGEGNVIPHKMTDIFCDLYDIREERKA